MQLITLLLLCVFSDAQNTGCTAAEKISGVTFDSKNMTCTDVSFPSAGSTSGPITMYGSLVMPKNFATAQENSVSGAVLITGSGPNARWGTTKDDRSQLFFDVAMALASKGLAVLVYDKRTCSAASFPIFCTKREFCIPVAIPGETMKTCDACTGCVNLYDTSVNDFVVDAAAAMQFLDKQAAVSASQTVMVGHSQGCTVALHAAAQTLTRQVILLNGAGVSPSDIVHLQLQRQLPILQNQLAAAKAIKDSDVVKVLEATIASWQCTIDTVQSQAELFIKGIIGDYVSVEYKIPAYTMELGVTVDATQYAALNATLHRDDPSRSLSDFGIFPAPSAWCPANFINPEANCLCDAAHATNLTCMLLCTAAADLGSNGPEQDPVKFARSWYDLSTPASRVSALALLGPTRPRILTVNSWTDVKVPPSEYVPLQQLLQDNSSVVRYCPAPPTSDCVDLWSSGALELTASTFANLTHELVELTAYMKPGYLAVDNQVLRALTDWTCQGVQCTDTTCPANPALTTPTPGATTTGCHGAASQGMADSLAAGGMAGLFFVGLVVGIVLTVVVVFVLRNKTKQRSDSTFTKSAGDGATGSYGAVEEN